MTSLYLKSITCILRQKYVIYWKIIGDLIPYSHAYEQALDAHGGILMENITDSVSNFEKYSA